VNVESGVAVGVAAETMSSPAQTDEGAPGGASDLQSSNSRLAAMVPIRVASSFVMPAQLRVGLIGKRAPAAGFAATANH